MANLIPRGTYAAVVSPVPLDNGSEVAVQFGTSKTKGTRQAYVAFEILRGPEAGQKIGWFGFFTDKTTERTLEALRACGFAGDELHTFPGQRPDREVEIVVDHEDYNGETNAKVQWVNEPGRGRGFVMESRMQDNDLRKFAATLKGALRKYPQTKAGQAVREAPSAAPTEGGGGWSGNDDPDPPKDNGFRRSAAPAPASDDDGIPF